MFKFTIEVTVHGQEYELSAHDENGRTIVPAFIHKTVIGGLHIINVTLARTASAALCKHKLVPEDVHRQRDLIER